MSSIQSQSKNDSKNLTNSNNKSTNSNTKYTFSTITDLKRIMDSNHKNKEASTIVDTNRMPTLASDYDDKTSSRYQNSFRKSKVVSNIREKFLIIQKLKNSNTNSKYNTANGFYPNNTSKIRENSEIHLVETEGNNNISTVRYPSLYSISTTNFPKNIRNIKLKSIGPLVKKIKIPYGYRLNPGSKTLEKDEIETINKLYSLRKTTTERFSQIENNNEINRGRIDLRSPSIKFNSTSNTANNSFNRLTKEVLGSNKDELKKMLKDKLFQKKMLKGKLIKTLRKSIIIEPDTMEQYKNNKNYVVTKGEHLKDYRTHKKIGIITQKSPDCITSNRDNYTSRYEDYYITPNELILKNFNNKEIGMIKSDPIYFKLRKSPLKDIEILKNRTLMEIFDDEDKKKLSLIQQLKTKKSHMPKVENSYLIDQSFMIGEQKKLSTISHIINKQNSTIIEHNNNVINEKNNNHKANDIHESNSTHKMPENTNLMNKETILNLITMFESDTKTKPNYEDKMKAYSVRKQIMNNAMMDKIRRNKEHSLTIKKIYSDKKHREREETILTNQFVSRIKDNYKLLENL